MVQCTGASWWSPSEDDAPPAQAAAIVFTLTDGRVRGGEWRGGGVEGWRSGGVEEWRSGGVEEWGSGGVEEWRSGGVEEEGMARVHSRVPWSLVPTMELPV